MSKVPPSQRRRRELYRSGVFPTLDSSQRLASLLGLTSGIIAAYYLWPALIGELRALWSVEAPLTPLISGTLLVRLLFYIIAPVALWLLTVTVCALVMCRMSFSLAAFSSASSRKRREHQRNAGSVILRAAGSLLGVFLGAGLSFFGLYVLMHSPHFSIVTSAIVGSKDTPLLEYPFALIIGPLALIIGGGVALSFLLSLVMGEVWFRLKHGMSKGEVRAESTEEESSPAMRAEVKGRMR